MSVLIVGLKCTLAALHASPGKSWWLSRRDSGQTNGWTPDHPSQTLSFPLDASNVIRHMKLYESIAGWRHILSTSLTCGKNLRIHRCLTHLADEVKWQCWLDESNWSGARYEAETGDCDDGHFDERQHRMIRLHLNHCTIISTVKPVNKCAIRHRNQASSSVGLE